MVDAECGAGTCQALTGPGGPCTCVGPRPEPQRNFCDPGEPGLGGGCCANTDCDPAGDPSLDTICQAEGNNAMDAYCGGAAPPAWNGCAEDACSDAVPCRGANQVCVPAGAYRFVRSSCVNATCRSDADCDQGPNGVCRARMEACLGTSYFCSYDDDPCRTNQDCRGNEPMLCQPQADGHGTECVRDFGPPP